MITALGGYGVSRIVETNLTETFVECHVQGLQISRRTLGPLYVALEVIRPQDMPSGSPDERTAVLIIFAELSSMLCDVAY